MVRFKPPRRMEPLFVVDDPTDILVLWRLVAEAKFQAQPDDQDLWGSPYAHALVQRISDAVLRSHELNGKQSAVDAHHRWVKSLPNNIALPIVRAQLKKDAASPWWHEQTYDQKLAYLQGCVAPFQPEVEFLEALLREAEAQQT